MLPRRSRRTWRSPVLGACLLVATLVGGLTLALAQPLAAGSRPAGADPAGQAYLPIVTDPRGRTDSTPTATPTAAPPPSSGGELRGLWVDAWNPGFKAQAETVGLVATAARGGFNTLFAQVRKRGDAYYAPRAPNQEPRATDLLGSYDPLADLVKTAHLSGLEVHAWFVMLPVWQQEKTPPTAPNHVYNAHPEWLTLNADGRRTFVPGEGYYLDPGVPAAQTWLVETVLDVVRHYGVDGIHLDYLRYPTGRQDGQPIAPGYNPIALQRYAAETGALGRPAPNDPRWQRWRADQIGQLVRRLYASALAVKPQLKISAAVPPEPAAAYAAALCDWPGWLRDHWLDAVAPMNFLPADQNAQFAQRVDQALDLAAGRHVYIGQAGYLNPSENSLTQLRSAAVRPIQGLIVFSYAYPIMSLLAPDPEAVARFYASVHDSLFAAPAPPPAMPWKTRPTTGLVQGVVRLNGVPIEGATLQLGDGPALARSDGNGYYALNELPPSKLRLTASAPNGARLSVDVTPPAGRVRTVDFALT